MPARSAKNSHARKPRRTRQTDRTAPAGELTVDQLAAETGVSVRNIRAYQTAGLLPPPRLKGRLALYDRSHVGKLVLIRDLRAQGFRLAAIGDMLSHTPEGAWPEYALISELFSKTFFTVEAPQRKAVADMAAHWREGATAAQKERLRHHGLYRAFGPDEVEVLSPALERIGEQLAELKVPLDTVLDLQDTLIQHCRHIADAYVDQLILAMARNVATQRDGDDLSQSLQDLFERLRPLAMGSLSAAFPVILQQAFRERVNAAASTEDQPRK